MGLLHGPCLSMETRLRFLSLTLLVILVSFLSPYLYFNDADLYSQGLFVKAALKLSEPTGRQILAAAEYISPNQLIAEFSEVTGHKATFAQVPGDVFKSFLPPQIADEMNDNMLLLQDPGYYQGADLADSLQLLDAKPTTWKEFVEANKAKWE